ncbi:hypothetical protein COO60DRAFT_123193 [Scenedesmus sp. NREL 46B-D3]|nr:hypothetical protein COO60DRAFT_123193 [Scenedesmus sp. NREL 46B-D3]
MTLKQCLTKQSQPTTHTTYLLSCLLDLQQTEPTRTEKLLHSQHRCSAHASTVTPKTVGPAAFRLCLKQVDALTLWHAQHTRCLVCPVLLPTAHTKWQRRWHYEMLLCATQPSACLCEVHRASRALPLSTNTQTATAAAAALPCPLAPLLITSAISCIQTQHARCCCCCCCC